MKTLSIAGTAAMFLVGGGIITHGITPLHHAIEHAAQVVGAPLAFAIPALLNGVCGLIAGTIALLIFNGIRKLLGKSNHA